MATFDSTHPLSPFQRAALAYQARPLRVTLDTPIATPALAARIGRVLAEHPELTVALLPVAAAAVAEQLPTPPVQRRGHDGGVELIAGALSIAALPSDRGTRLSIRADAISVDATSIELLCERLTSDTSAPAGVAFFDVAASHAAMVREGELDPESAHWRALGTGEDPRAALGLALSRTRCAEDTATVPIDGATLQGFAAAHGVAAADVLYLGLQLLVDRVCRTRAVIGRLEDARELMGLERRLGPLTQVTLDPVEIDPDVTVRTLLARQTMRLAKHAEMSGGPALGDGREPPTVIFDPKDTWQLPDGWCLVDALEARAGAVLLRAISNGDGVVLVAQTCDGTSATSLRAVLAAWADVVSALMSYPDTAWRAVPLGEGDRVADVPARDPAEDLCSRLDAMVTSAPDALAVRHGALAMTRAELRDRIGDFVAALEPLPPPGVVAIIEGLVPDLVAAWLAVSWSGGTFLPLSPVEPRQRIERALVESGAGAVLIGSGAPVFEAPSGCRVIRIGDVPWRGIAPGPPVVPATDQAAYLLRTSGSSASPKLVAVSRSSLNNYLRWVAEQLVPDTMLLPAVSSPIFDACFKQLLGPLYAGASTWLLQADPLDTEQALAEMARADAPLSLNCTPTYWSELLDVSARLDRRPRIRTLLLGGERLTDALRRRTRTAYPDAEMWNLYGPTETTATAAAGRLDSGDPIHVGYPVAGAAIVVADRHGRPLPRGMTGEVWIGGPGVAMGYVSGDTGAFGAWGVGAQTRRVYRTGDAGRFDDHGRLHILGRIDDQIKLRGWRIEPREIESIAGGISGVASARVLLDTRIEPNEIRLFILGEAEPAAVLQHLRAWLPPAMVPSTVTRLERFPRTATGKLDERALLEYAQSPTGAAAPAYDEPLEEEIASIWREVVGRGWPRVEQDFFTAGGHSLLLARLVNQLRARGHDALSLRHVVRNPTVKSIAAIIRAGRTEVRDTPGA